MKRELTPQAMVMLEQQAKANIKKCNEQIRKKTPKYITTGSLSRMNGS